VTTFIALLRGVNVGKANRVPMAEFRTLLARHAAYLHCANGILESKAGAALLGNVGRAATTRNLATTLKLLALAEKSR
jgi:uncharacterized protein (DUF1697 family)